MRFKYFAKSKNLFLLYKNFVRVISLAWKIDKLGFILTLLFSILMKLLPLLSSFLFSQSLNYLVIYLSENNNTYVLQQVYIFSVLALVSWWFIHVVDYLYNFFDSVHWYKWHEYMYIQVPSKISSLDIGKFENSKFNNLINKVEQGAASRPANFITNFIRLLSTTLSIIFTVYVIISFNIFLLPVIIIAQIPGLIFLIKSGKQMWGIWDASGDISRMASYNSNYLSNKNWLAEIRIFGIRDYVIDKLRLLFNKFQNEFISIERKTLIRNLFASSIENIVFIAIQLWLLGLVLQPNSYLKLGDFNFLRSAIEQFANSNKSFMFTIAKLYEHNLYISDLFKLLSTTNKIQVKPNAIKVNNLKAPNIEFRNVSFSYPKTRKKIFDNLNIKINSGEDIALVGENGAGKSTFIKLLLRFYDVDDGEILINGVNIKDIDLESFYKKIGILFQDFNKYYYPVKENIAIGDISNPIDLNKVIESSIRSGAYEFIDKYKYKFEQILSRDFEHGIEPSGGQWQRIALARAFYRNANILILDEPTSAIDAKGEYEIFQEIQKLQEEKTTIIISHRFSTVRNADKIYVLENGKIIEQGTHDELMFVNNGKYKKMFELQAEGYK